VSDPNALGPALKTAMAARKPAVIDVVTSLNDITFADITSPLAKVAQQVKR
jgi:thiamine pyrophosphate-dependent acetolactate synthase large subunit-like protein